jgi:hypothetical protein
MWARAATGGIWHYCADLDRGGILCSSTVEAQNLEVVRPERPSDLDNPICYRCWFELEWTKTLAACQNDADKDWLAGASFGELDSKNSTRLSSVLGPSTADRLRVLYTLAETHDHESACPENPRFDSSVADNVEVERPPSQPKFRQPPKRLRVRDNRWVMDKAFVYCIIFLIVVIPLLVVLLLSWK